MRIAKIKHFVKSLVEIGVENKCFDNLLADLKEVDKKISENSDLKRYLNDVQVTLAKKKQALQVVFQDFIGKLTYNFVYLLLQNNKINWLPEIIVEAGKMHLKHQDLVEVICESVIPLPNESQKELEKIFEKKVGQKIVFKNILNEKLLGGLRIKIGDSVIDSSLKGKIERLNETIEKLQ
ncbi:MAG: ATP synthase F1 subunit delta [Patescibacteria group bacterium]